MSSAACGIFDFHDSFFASSSIFWASATTSHLQLYTYSWRLLGWRHSCRAYMPPHSWHQRIYRYGAWYRDLVWIITLDYAVKYIKYRTIVAVKIITNHECVSCWSMTNGSHTGDGFLWLALNIVHMTARPSVLSLKVARISYTEECTENIYSPLCTFAT